MERDGAQTFGVRRVVLPSGKTVEVVFFREVDAAGGDGQPHEPHRDLHVCVACPSELVHPVEWEPSGPENWKVLLRCPNCEVYSEGVFNQATLDAFDEELDGGQDALERDYTRLMRANMAEEIDRFVRALRADAVLPEDF